VNNDKTSAADLLGPWVNPNWESGMVVRCKVAWEKPLEELTNLELATFLDQSICVERVLPIALKRVESKVDDETEYYDGHLLGSIERCTSKQRQN
jgi:hypothetical protein